MRRVQIIFAIAISAFFIGCPARSLQPLFTEKDITYNPALEGKWTDGEDTYTFKRLDEKNYRIFVVEQKTIDSTGRAEADSDTMAFVGQLGQLGRSWFLDTYPAREVTDFHLVPTHMIFETWLEGDTLRLASLEGDWLKKTIKTKRLKAQYALSNGDIILTGSTEELQEIARNFANDENAFPNPEEFVRMK
jgi:hypothetical protein